MVSDFWGLEQKIADVTEAIRAAGKTEVDIDLEPLTEKLETIDEHLIELAEGLRVDMATLTVAIQMLATELSTMNQLAQSTSARDKNTGNWAEGT